MKARKAAFLGLLILLLGLGACSSGSSSFSGGGGSSGTSISILPTSVAAGSPDLPVTITGSNFANAPHNLSWAVWSEGSGNTKLATTFVSSTQLTAVIPAALLSIPVMAQVFVDTGDPMGDVAPAQSKAVSFSVTAPVVSIFPSSETLGPNGTRQFVATFNGNNADVIWSVREGAAGGTITMTGLYTVPASLGTFHVSATLVADPAQSATAPVSVVASGFTETGSMSTPRSGHTATLLTNGKVLIVGGDDARAELFDPATETFAPTGSMSTSRYGATATLLANGKVLIAGGLGPGANELPRLDTAELYDPLSGTFSGTGSMAVPRFLHAATLLNDGKILITGGTTDNAGGGVATANAELYDPTTGVFTTVGSMFSDRAQHTATLLANGEVLIAGGWNGHRADGPEDPPYDPLFGELYEPSSASFTKTGGMSTTRIGHKAIRLTNGKVLELGGIPNPQNTHDRLDPRYAELYDAGAHTFSSPWDLAISRTGYSATLLTTGKMLLAGGEDHDRTVGTAELLDPDSGSLTATGGLVTERKGHTATLLNDGRVLVAGGVDSNGNALATAELYK